MTKRWYYQMLMEEFGPVTAEQLSALIEEGTVAGSDLVRAEHSDRWFEASEWSPDNPAGEASELEEISDLSQLSFEFENSGDSHRARIPAGLSPEAPRPVPARPVSSPALDDVEPANWFYQSLGQTLGPLPLSSLVSLAEAGGISETDLVRMGVSSPWKPASAIEELSIVLMSVERSVVHSPQLSLATQKRLGAQATAVALAPETSPDVEVQPAALKAEQPSDVGREAADSTDSQPEVETRAPRAGGKGKVTRKEAAKRREDALIDGILGDVFSEEPPPSRPSMAASSGSMSSGPVASSAGPVSSSPPMASASMTSSAAMMSRPTFSPAVKSSSSSSDSMMPLLKIGGIVVLVIGVLVGGYFGLSGLTGPPIDLYVTKLKTAAMDLKELGDKPTETQWLSFCAKKNEFTSYQNTILEANASGEAVDKCKLAITLLLRATSTSYKNANDVKKASDDFVKAVEKL